MVVSRVCSLLAAELAREGHAAVTRGLPGDALRARDVRGVRVGALALLQGRPGLEVLLAVAREGRSGVRDPRG